MKPFNRISFPPPGQARLVCLVVFALLLPLTVRAASPSSTDGGGFFSKDNTLTIASLTESEPGTDGFVPSTSKLYSLLKKYEDRFYLGPVVGTAYRFQERYTRNEDGSIAYDDNGKPLREKTSGRLLTLAALHYTIKPWLSVFAAYGLENSTFKDILQPGQIVGIGFAYTDYVGLTLAGCVEIADGGGWEAFQYTHNYMLMVGIVVHGLDLDLTGVFEDD